MLSDAHGFAEELNLRYLQGITVRIRAISKAFTLKPFD
jgi:hypothetical protein